MIIIVDALNRHEYSGLLDRMFQLRAQVFGGRLGWDVKVENGREIDQFDALDPGYVIGVNEDGNVVSCVRALQTTGPHMLADVFSAILGGEPPLRSPTVWESTRFCVDTKRLSLGRGPGTISGATSELMIGSLEWAMSAGISDIVTVIDPIMNKVLKRSNNAPYDYLGSTTQMGKVPAMAALLDCTPERVAQVREFSGIHHDVFASPSEAECFKDKPRSAEPKTNSQMQRYLEEQLDQAHTPKDRDAALRTWSQLHDRGLIDSLPPARAGRRVS
ncbi:acyl-homoserine-lactone synthase [Palleronia sp.]|uniref:acyl-homoserine-lactone synthase n=1 Tax=Palleronia sp. TaxID=1940284 RepID=UPI0035C7D0F5